MVKEAVTGYGDIVDFKFFADISIVIVIEIPGRNIDALYDELKKHILLDESGELNLKSDMERIIYLNLTFTRATGDSKVKVPSVPG